MRSECGGLPQSETYGAVHQSPRPDETAGFRDRPMLVSESHREGRVRSSKLVNAYLHFGSALRFRSAAAFMGSATLMFVPGDHTKRAIWINSFFVNTTANLEHLFTESNSWPPPFIDWRTFGQGWCSRSNYVQSDRASNHIIPVGSAILFRQQRRPWIYSFT